MGGAVGAPVRLAPGAPHHARLRRHGAGGLLRVPLPHRRAEPRPHLDRVVPQSHVDPDLHRQLPVFVSCTKDLRRCGAWQSRSAFYVVLPLLAYLLLVVLCRRRWRPRAAVGRARRVGVITPGLAGPRAHHRLPARRGAAVAADVSGVVHRRHDAGGACRRWAFGRMRWRAFRWRWCATSSCRRRCGGSPPRRPPNSGSAGQGGLLRRRSRR